MYFTSCSDKSTSILKDYMQLSLLNDLTDFHKLRPDIKSVLAMLDIQHHKQQGSCLRLNSISDRVYSPETEIRLQSGALSESENRFNEPLFREKKIIMFYDSIRHVIKAQSRDDDTSTMQHSEIFAGIAHELQKLQEHKSDHKILIVYSNLIENSEILNLYSQSALDILEKNCCVIEKKLEEVKILPDNLKGIVIIFRFIPQNREEDKIFGLMTALYKSLLENKRGAKVIVQTSNNQYYD